VTKNSRLSSVAVWLGQAGIHDNSAATVGKTRSTQAADLPLECSPCRSKRSAGFSVQWLIVKSLDRVPPCLAISLI